MQVTNELNALLSLIDDPDSEVYESVSGKLMGYGRPIIPDLENLWENQPDEKVQERIQFIIRRLQIREIGVDLKEWKKAGCADLLEGALLVAKYDQPDLCLDSLRNEVELLKKNIWLELNNFLTPLEQAKVMKNMVYEFFDLKGTQLMNTQVNDFFLHHVIQKKQGNTLTNGLLYHLLCQQLNIKTSLLFFPNTYMLAFYSTGLLYEPKYPPVRESIQFYVEPATGQPYTQHDVDIYFKRSKLEPTVNYFTPLSHENIIVRLLLETAKCYQEKNNDPIKAADLTSLADQIKLYNPDT